MAMEISEPISPSNMENKKTPVIGVYSSPSFSPEARQNRENEILYNLTQLFSPTMSPRHAIFMV